MNEGGGGRVRRTPGRADDNQCASGIRDVYSI